MLGLQAVVTAAFLLLGAGASLAQPQPSETVTPAPQPAPPAQPNPAPPAPPPPPSEQGTPAIVLSPDESDGIIGKSVRSAAGEDMGRIVDIIVSSGNQPRAAVIDFGGFLGVGSRKIAVDWRLLQYSRTGKTWGVTSALTRAQVRVSPEYKPGEPVVVLGLPSIPASAAAPAVSAVAAPPPANPTPPAPVAANSPPAAPAPEVAPAAPAAPSAPAEGQADRPRTPQ
jgi:hypothetical protein